MKFPNDYSKVLPPGICNRGLLHGIRPSKTVGAPGELLKGSLAFPGGFVDYNEDPDDACLRELKEECNIEGYEPKLVTVAGNPKRDPRKHIISIVYHVLFSIYFQLKNAFWTARVANRPPPLVFF